MLRNVADIKTIIYMIITTALLFIQWQLNEMNILLYILCLFFAVSVAVIAHNHNHLQIWKSKTMNILTDYWLTLFYGFPVFGWIPTHNKNHHKLNNREGDYTITYRYSEKNNLFTLLPYPSISGYFQQKAINIYLKDMKRINIQKYWLSISQYAVLVLFIAVGLWIDWQKALIYIVIPQQFSLYSVMIFNYVQHVHADEESKTNHSRNFVGFINPLLFNNGYHTIHHDKPGLHWSETPAEFKKIEASIDPSLNERSMAWYLFRTYILGIFSAKFRTKSMRLERQKKEAELATV